jgi:hypothetical protein
LPEQNTETNAKARKGLGRETFELLLLVWDRLLGSRDAGTNEKLAGETELEDVKLVFSIRPKDLRDAAVLRYLKPYYDVAIGLELARPDADDPVTLLRHIQTATTTQAYTLNLRKPHLAFYFFGAEQLGGAAILYEPGLSVDIVRLAEHAPRIQQLARERAKLALPEPLDTRLKGLGDTECLPWPYDEVCPYRLPPTVTFPDQVRWQLSQE